MLHDRRVNMNQRQRAEAAVNLLRHAMKSDDEPAVELLTDLIAAERLYFYCCDDDGKPIDTMDDFVESINAEIDDHVPYGISAGILSDASRDRQRAQRQRLRESM